MVQSARATSFPLPCLLVLPEFPTNLIIPRSPDTQDARENPKSIMPFRNLISDLKSQVKDLQNKGQQYLANQQQQPHPPNQQYPGQYQHPQQPPPVPQSTHPSHQQQQHQFQGQNAPPQQPLPGPPGIYWQPRFDPNIPVSQEWEHKQGNNNGWGNNEIENYTSEPGNSFQ
jgi:hypothetical protein